MADKNRQIMKKSYDVDNGVFTLAFIDGQPITGKLSDLKPEVVQQAALHGLLQKIGDAAAGHGDNPDAAFEACMAVFERLQLGDWKKPTEKGEGARPTMVFEAIIRAYKKKGKDVTLEAVTAAFSGDDGEEKRKSILKDPRVKAEYEALKAESAAKRAAAALAAAEKSEGTDAEQGLEGLSL
jgi:hypothetical protein